jgi:hypothetical protein
MSKEHLIESEMQVNEPFQNNIQKKVCEVFVKTDFEEDEK